MEKTKKSLLLWYEKSNYYMPWRETNDAYKIWISEIMLQQTQVQTVVKYYNKWLQAYPTIQSVSSANIDSLLKLWEGLGYYQRVHNIHEASKMIVKKHKGKVPDTYDKLIELKGIGDYTASAILSIAFNKQYPAIDGNLKRVISRFYALSNSTNMLQTFKDKVLLFMKNKNSGDVNQALMDLGREICTSHLPKCSVCPVSSSCIAYSTNQINKFPEKTPSKQKPSFDVIIGMIYKKNKFLISKRNNKGLLAGLWELPGGKKRIKENNRDCLKREIKEELDIDINITKKIGEIKHQYSHFKINLIGYHCIYKAGKPKPITSNGLKWITKKNINSFAFPKSTIKLFNLIEESK